MFIAAFAWTLFRTTLVVAALAIVRKHKIDLAVIDVDSGDTDAQRIAETIGDAAALTIEAMPDRIKVEIVAIQRRDMHQPVHIDVIQHHEQAETCDAGDDAVKLLANPVDQVLALERIHRIPGRLVRTPLGGRAVFRNSLQFRHAIVEILRLAALPHMLQSPMHQQVRIAANRRGEMRIGVIGESKVSHVFGAVDSL